MYNRDQYVGVEWKDIEFNFTPQRQSGSRELGKHEQSRSKVLIAQKQVQDDAKGIYLFGEYNWR